MQAKHLHLLPLLLVLSLLMFRTASAKELVNVTIVGPGLTRPVELTDAQRLRVFRELGFAAQIDKPFSAATQPYFELRMGVGTGTEIVATDVYHYYAATREHPSYIYYADVIGGWSSIEGQYFLLPTDRDQAVRDLLASLGAALPGTAVQATTAQILPATASNVLPIFWISIISCWCVGVGIALRLKHSAW